MDVSFSGILSQLDQLIGATFTQQPAVCVFSLLISGALRGAQFGAENPPAFQEISGEGQNLNAKLP